MRIGDTTTFSLERKLKAPKLSNKLILWCDSPNNRYADRNGGYTRIFHTTPKRGDNTKMAIIELV